MWSQTCLSSFDLASVASAANSSALRRYEAFSIAVPDEYTKPISWHHPVAAKAIRKKRLKCDRTKSAPLSGALSRTGGYRHTCRCNARRVAVPFLRLSSTRAELCQRRSRRSKVRACLPPIPPRRHLEPTHPLAPHLGKSTHH